MVIENSFTASSVPNLLPALSKPIKTIVHRGRMRFASQFERTHEISIFQRLPGRAGQKLDSRAFGLGNLYREISCAKLGEILWLRISSVHDVIVQSTVCLSLVFQLQKLNQSYLVKVRYV